MWDLNRLRVWRAVVAAGSVNEAARNLQYAPASISQHIIGLQKSVGFPLYHRVGRGIEITDAGQRLAEESAAIFTESGRLDSIVDRIRSGPRPHMTISCFSSVAKEWVPTVLRRVVRQFPQLRFDIMTNEPLLGAERRYGDIDITNEPGFLGPSQVHGYAREVLLEDDYMVVLQQEHPLAGEQEVPVALLAEERMVDLDVFGSPTGQVIGHATSAAGFTPNYVARADDHYGILAMIAAGIGITVLPRLAIGDLPPQLTARPLVDPIPFRRIVLHIKRDVAHLEYMVAVTQAVREQAAAAPGYPNYLDERGGS